MASITLTQTARARPRGRRGGGLRFPKPTGALLAFWHREAGKLHAQPELAPQEAKLLRFIVDNADLLNVSVRPGDGSPGWDRWLLIPAPTWLIDGLAQVDATLDGLEPDADRENDTADAEPDDEGDPYQDLEHEQWSWIGGLAHEDQDQTKFKGG